MTFLVPILAATGIWLFMSGLPLGRRVGLRDRVEPYLSGLGDRPSRLLTPATSRRPVPPWAHAMVKRLWPVGSSKLRSRLDASGSTGSVDDFRLEQLIWGMGGAICGIAVLMSIRMVSAVDLRAVPAMSIVAFVTGFLGRDWWLGHQIERRQNTLSAGLPAAIDLVTLCVMAGESVAGACARVAQTMPSGIGVEFARVVADVRAGSPIVQALEGMAEWVPEPEVGRFVDALCTGIEKGAPLAETLRAQADDGREARRRRLLEMGGRREVLMLVPVVFLIMPTVVVLALFPGLVSLDLLVP